MKAADSLIQESTLYKSILSNHTDKKALPKTMTEIIQKDLVSTIHPIIMLRAEQILDHTMHTRLPAGGL